MKTTFFTKNLFISKLILAIALFTGMPNFVNAQAVYQTSAGNERAIKVSGTSNVHDWYMKTSNIESQGYFNIDAKNILRSVDNLNFTTYSKSLKSEHKGMDERTYKLLKADKQPKITYKLQSAVVTPLQKNNYLIKSTGTLTIAGVSHTIHMDVTGVVNNNNTVTCTGSTKIKLTDYKLTPPSYMAGAMKVGNELIIDFDIAFKKAS